MWILALSLVILGIICYIADIWMRKTGRLNNTPQETTTQNSSECCGKHLVCEKESLLLANKNIVYYDDEELDEFKGTGECEYSEEAIKVFSDVFYTLREEEVAGWLRSLQLREIALPEQLKEEALMIVRERRFGTQ